MADVVVVIGAGGIGQAIARRVGSGRTVLFADFDERVQNEAVLAMHELASPSGPVYRSMIEASPAKRMGTPDEVAGAAAFLLGAEGAFVTGSDLLMDGGVIAAMRSGKLKLPGLN